MTLKGLIQIQVNQGNYNVEHVDNQNRVNGTKKYLVEKIITKTFLKYLCELRWRKLTAGKLYTTFYLNIFYNPNILTELLFSYRK